MFDGEQRDLKRACAKKSHLTPDEDDFHFLRLSECAWVEISGIKFENCWPAAILGRGARHIRISNCNAEGGQYFVFLRNSERRFFSDIPCHSVTLEDMTWTQDPKHEMWDGDVSWEEIKDTEHEASRLNGGFLGSFDIAGNIVVRRCRISHAFNGIRMDARWGSTADSGRNVDVRIEDCEFDHIRDNAIEPEKTARNWWIRGCTFHNTHATFSLHGFTGGWIYICGNRIWSTSKPKDSGHTGGKVFKFLNVGKLPEGPICVLNNSCYLKSSYCKRGQTRNLIHANNAIAFAKPSKSMFSGGDQHMLWHDSYTFRGDVSNNDLFPGGFPKEYRYEIQGHHVESLFSDPSNGDFAVDPESLLAPAEHDRPKLPPESIHIPLPDGKIMEVPGDGLIGAIQRDGKTFDAVPFVPTQTNWDEMF